MANPSHPDMMQAALSASERLQKLWRAYFMAEMQGKEISASQFAALHTIESHSSITSRELGAHMCVTPGAITQLVDSLATKGLVERQPDPQDRRSIHLVLTKVGQEHIRALHQKRRAILQEVYGSLSDTELAAYLTAQDKMITQLQNLRDNAKKEDTK